MAKKPKPRTWNGLTQYRVTGAGCRQGHYILAKSETDAVKQLHKSLKSSKSFMSTPYKEYDVDAWTGVAKYWKPKRVIIGGK